MSWPLINKTADSRWIIAGHTDNQGSADLNAKLSQARAASVIAWLGSHGVAGARLTTQGGRQRHGSRKSIESPRGNHATEVADFFPLFNLD
jgi:hypothetical protein